MKKIWQAIFLGCGLIGLQSWLAPESVFAGVPCDDSAPLNPNNCVYEWVDKEIKLEIDVSGSIDATEYAAQLQSYVSAFRNPDIQRLIAGHSQGIAFSLGMWSSGQDYPIANLDVLDTYATSIVNPALFGSNSGIGSQWFILRFNGLNDPLLADPTNINTNPAAAFARIIDYYSNPTYRTNFLDPASTPGRRPVGSTFGSATNPAGAIRAANQGYLIQDLTAAPGTYYNLSGFQNNVVGDPEQFGGGLTPGTATNPYIRSSYERIIDISTDGIQNTDIDGGNPQSGGAIYGNPNTQNCIDVAGVCQPAINTALADFVTGASNRGNVVNTIGIVSNVDQGSFNFASGNVATYLTNGASVPQNIVATSDPNYQPFATATLGPIASSNSPNTEALGFEAGCFDNGGMTPTCVDGGGTSPAVFTNALSQKLEAELEAVPFEFQPGYGLILGLGIFSFRYWQGQKKEKLDLDKLEENQDSKMETETINLNVKEVKEEIMG